jgi:hypothetical protein
MKLRYKLLSLKQLENEKKEILVYRTSAVKYVITAFK